MSVFTIPNQGQIRQIGRSETEGEIMESFSIDINNPYGKIKPSRKLVKVLDESDFDGGNSRLAALAVYKKSDESTPRFYAVTSDDVQICQVSQDPTDPANWQSINDLPGIFDMTGIDNNSDAVVFNDFLLISKTTDILSWNDSTDDVDWWTNVTSGSALTTGFAHTMHVHRGGQETLFVTDVNRVRYYNTTAGQSTVTLGADQIACCVDSGVDATWVGTYSESSDNAYAYEIYIGEQLDGVPVARNAYKIDGRAVLSIAVLGNVPYIVTDRGNLQVFNGAGFVTIAQLPFSGSSVVLDGVRMGNISDNNDQRPVHPKGMKGHNDSIYINVNTQTENLGFNQDPYAKNSPAGVWEYNTVTRQLHHRYAFSNTSTDNGAKNLNFSGPILIADTPYTFLMAGGEIDNTTSGLFMESVTRFGYFVTPEIMSGSVTDAYESVYLKSKTLSGSDNIELKYRITKQDPSFGNVTLAETNVINTEDAVTVAVGDEVMIIDGDIPGKFAHVIAVSQGEVVTSCTLDRDIGTVGQTGVAEFNNFKLDGLQVENGVITNEANVYDSTSGEVKRFGGHGTNPWIQYKVVMQGDVELREFISKSNSKEEL